MLHPTLASLKIQLGDAFSVNSAMSDRNRPLVLLDDLAVAGGPSSSLVLVLPAPALNTKTAAPWPKLIVSSCSTTSPAGTALRRAIHCVSKAAGASTFVLTAPVTS